MDNYSEENHPGANRNNVGKKVSVEFSDGDERASRWLTLKL